MKKILGSLIIASLTVTQFGCSSNTQGENTGLGAATGAVVGGVVGGVASGGKAVAIGVGAVAGALIGGVIGQSMQASDDVYVHRALNSGKKVSWTNSHTHITYTVTPMKNHFIMNGKYCRKYVTSANINGKMHHSKGVACRHTNGAWTLAS